MLIKTLIVDQNGMSVKFKCETRQVTFGNLVSLFNYDIDIMYMTNLKTYAFVACS